MNENCDFVYLDQPESLKIQYYDRGKGETLIILHGANNTIEINKKLLELLTKRFRVIMMVYPGLGKSESLKIYNTESLLEVIDGFIQKLNLESYYLCGISVGGCLALKYIHQYSPKNIKGLILFSPYFRPFSKDLFKNALSLIYNYIHTKLNFRNILLFLPAAFISINPLKAIRHSKFVVRVEMKEEEFDINLPTLIIVGAKDPVTDSLFTIEKFKNKKNVALKVYPKLMHDAFVNLESSLIKVIHDFISGNEV